MNITGKLMCIGFIGLTGVVGYICYDKYEKQKKGIQIETEIRKIAETREMLRDLQTILKNRSLIQYADGNYRLSYPSSLEELQEREAGYSDKKVPLVDTWGKRFNYRQQWDERFFTRMEGKTVMYTDEHYELSSSGPDGIPQTGDDIQAWYIPNHEWGAIERLKREYREAIREATKSGLEKLMDKLGR